MRHAWTIVGAACQTARRVPSRAAAAQHQEGGRCSQGIILYLGWRLQDHAVGATTLAGPYHCGGLRGVAHGGDDARQARSLSRRTPSHGGAHESSPCTLAVN
jgi:hypothetical protein